MLEKLAVVSKVPPQPVKATNIAPQSVHLITEAAFDAPIDTATALQLADYVAVVRAGVVPLQGSHGAPQGARCRCSPLLQASS